jgi:hypothetical protein
MWLYIVDNKELIINALDLVSFLLVTPQIIRLVNPTFVQIMPGLFLMAIIAVAQKLFISVVSFDLNSVLGAGTVIAGSLIISLVVVFTIFRFVVSVVDWTGTHLFLLGVVIFFLSRLLAVAVALYATH